jgi:hypothetical protein
MYHAVGTKIGRSNYQYDNTCNATSLLTQCDSSSSLPGAPELDILEAMPGKEVLEHTSTQKPYYSASLQISPGMFSEQKNVKLCASGFVCCYVVL